MSCAGNVHFDENSQLQKEDPAPTAEPVVTITPQKQGTETCFDIDNNKKFDALTDGLLIMRHISGLHGSELIRNSVSSDAKRKEIIDLERFLATRDLDADGNGIVDHNDALLIMRAHFGLTGEGLTQGLLDDKSVRKTSDEIIKFVFSCPAQD
jgi:hypothetical protein